MNNAFPLPDRSDPLIAPFWDWAAKSELRLPRRADGGFDWYPQSTDLEWVRLSGRGTLFSWSIVTRALHPGYADMAPYISALVLPDDAPGVRLVTRMIDVAPEALRLGMPVTVRFLDLGTPGPDTGVVGPLFVPA